MIDKIGERCTGCYACASACPKQCIRMVEDKAGFWYPRIDAATCVHCERCEQACPVLSPLENRRTKEDVAAYALIHRDEEVRRRSSSGGAFSALASAVLNQGGVVFGAAFDENFNVRHIAVTEEKDLEKLRGSKYVQSRIGDCYSQAKQYLDAGRLVYFSGTACQTSGLRGFLGKDYPNLLTQDLICHGVPSPMVWRKYVQLRERLARAKTESVFFRDKAHGWKNWHLKMRFADGSSYELSQFKHPYIIAYLRGICSRLCCYDCAFKDRYRLADFTLADLWGVDGLIPEINDDKGVSLLLVNSGKAAAFLEKISASVRLYPLDFDAAVKENGALVESETRNPQREAFLREMRRRPFDVVAGKYQGEYTLERRLRWFARRALGNKRYEKIFHN